MEFRPKSTFETRSSRNKKSYRCFNNFKCENVIKNQNILPNKISYISGISRFAHLFALLFLINKNRPILQVCFLLE